MQPTKKNHVVFFLRFRQRPKLIQIDARTHRARVTGRKPEPFLQRAIIARHHRAKAIHKRRLNGRPLRALFFAPKQQAIDEPRPLSLRPEHVLNLYPPWHTQSPCNRPGAIGLHHERTGGVHQIITRLRPSQGGKATPCVRGKVPPGLMQLRSGIEKIITAEVAAFRCQFTQLRLRHPTGKKIDRVPIGHPHPRHVHILTQHARDGNAVIERVMNEQNSHGRYQSGASNSATKSALAKGNGQPNGVPIAWCRATSFHSRGPWRRRNQPRSSPSALRSIKRSKSGL